MMSSAFSKKEALCRMDGAFWSRKSLSRGLTGLSRWTKQSRASGGDVVSSLFGRSVWVVWLALYSYDSQVGALELGFGVRGRLSWAKQKTAVREVVPDSRCCEPVGYSAA